MEGESHSSPLNIHNRATEPRPSPFAVMQAIFHVVFFCFSFFLPPTTISIPQLLSVIEGERGGEGLQQSIVDTSSQLSIAAMQATIHVVFVFTTPHGHLLFLNCFCSPRGKGGMGAEWQRVSGSPLWTPPVINSANRVVVEAGTACCPG